MYVILHTAISTLQAKNEKLQAAMEQVKHQLDSYRCGEERRRDNMKRLTERLGNSVINVKYATEHETAIHRLAAIEEILGDEYDLDRLRKLKQADDEGRYGIPPVRLHQHIFRIFSGEIREETVCDAMWEPFTPRPRWKVWVMGSGLPYYWHDVFGKTVFLTREEAEAALEGAVWLN